MTTPRGALVDTEVEELTAPGEVGELGILPGHIPLMSALKPGVLWYRTKQHAAVVAVGQGFLQVAPRSAAGEGAGAPTAHPGPSAGADRDRVLVLVDEAVAAADVDPATAESDLAAADRELAAWKGELDGAYRALVIRRGWAQARVDAAARANPH